MDDLAIDRAIGKAFHVISRAVHSSVYVSVCISLCVCVCVCVCVSVHEECVHACAVQVLSQFATVPNRSLILVMFPPFIYSIE